MPLLRSTYHQKKLLKHYLWVPVIGAVRGVAPPVWEGRGRSSAAFVTSVVSFPPVGEGEAGEVGGRVQTWGVGRKKGHTALWVTTSSGGAQHRWSLSSHPPTWERELEPPQASWSCSPSFTDLPKSPHPGIAYSLASLNHRLTSSSHVFSYFREWIFIYFLKLEFVPWEFLLEHSFL